MQQLLDFPDVMSVEQTVSVTGYGFSSVIRWCKIGRLKSFHLRNVYKIPKEHLLEFLCSEDYCKISVKPEKHRRSNDEIVSRWRQQCEDEKIVST